MTTTEIATITTMRIPMISAADETSPIKTSIATGRTKNFMPIINFITLCSYSCVVTAIYPMHSDL